MHPTTIGVQPNLQLTAKAPALPGPQPDAEGSSATPRDVSSETNAPAAAAAKFGSGLIRYRIEYVGEESGSISVPGRPDDQPDTASTEPPAFEHVEVRLSGQQNLSATGNIVDIEKTDKGKGRAYINILSPAVAEALRCVVDYFPDLEFAGNVIKIPEPYSVFVFFEKELTEYRERVAKTVQDDASTCLNRWAAKHLAVVQDFVKQQVQEAVDAERARHARGYATFDMLWLLFKPGSDVYYDLYNYGEHEPYVVSGVSFDRINGATTTYELTFWNMDADSSWVGPCQTRPTIERFSGEKKIPSLSAYPCEYLRFADDTTEEDTIAIRQHFIDRGRKWYNLRRRIRCYHFDGVTTSFPRRAYSSLAMMDPIQYFMWQDTERRVLSSTVKQPSGPLRLCNCESCEENIYRYAVKPRFTGGYTKINPLVVESLTDHEYFLCDQMVESFLFKTRSWQFLHIDGFQEPTFDSALFDRLVMKSSTKETIRSVTQMYIRDTVDLSKQEETSFNHITKVHKSTRRKKPEATWSADFIEGKGEGLAILLHGRPGVGKTYTAECIADLTERPLLSLTCSDIGVKAETIEANLLKWFKVAENWGAIMLIDEADIYMEQRQVQDIERNHLVAGFLRALEYYKGIVFLTTNRVGTFDEAFISRLHIQIHYPEFEDEDRDRLWDTFFQKFEDDRETTMRITQSAKDYVQSQELRALRWNGREIRNSFQVAVALAEAQGQKDKEGRVLVKSDHIKATVQMSREFRDYLVKLHKGDLSKRASLMGHRYDAYGKEASSSGKY